MRGRVSRPPAAGGPIACVGFHRGDKRSRRLRERLQETRVQETVRLGIEDPVGAEIAGVVGGPAQIVRSVGVDLLVGELRVPGAERRVVVTETRSHLARRDEQLVPRPDHLRAAAVERDLHDVLGRHFGFVDRRDGLRMVVHRRLAPVELRRVDRGEVHHAEPHVAAVVQQFRASRVEEATARELRGAVRRLQRYADERERRADVDDRAVIARAHTFERGHRPPHLAEERHFDRAAKIVGCRFEDRRETGCHRVVDPYIDRAELVLGTLRRPCHRLGVGDIGR